MTPPPLTPYDINAPACEGTRLTYHRQPAASDEGHDLRSLALYQGFNQDEKSFNAADCGSLERGCEVARLPHLQRGQLEAQRLSCRSCMAILDLLGGIGRVPQHGQTRSTASRFVEQLEPLRSQLWGDSGQPRDVPAGPS